MKIKSFNIYEFGNLAKQSIQNVPSGLLIFLGQNEAGKSTSLEFFRTILTGFPATRSKKAREGIFAQKSSSMGGFLEVETQNADVLRLERTLNNFQVYNEEGAKIPSVIYESLLAGTTRDIYSSIYGFSLSELQVIDTLEANEVRDVLYGTSFGLGLYSPQKSLDYIDSLISAKNSKSLLSNDSFKNFFKNNCQRLEEIQKEIRHLVEQNKTIDIFYDDYNQAKEDFDSILVNENEVYEVIRALDTKIRAWEHYKEWFLVQKELERLPQLTKNFPENAIEKLHRLQDLEYAASRNTKNLQDKKEKFIKAISEKEHNEKLYNLLPNLQELLEYKASYRNALIQLPNINNSILRNEEELERHLEFLGKNWTFERAKEIDSSLFLHEQIEEYFSKFSKNEQSLQISCSKIEALKQEKSLSESELQKIKQNFANIPELSQQLDTASRGILTNLLRKAEEGHTKLPEKIRSLNFAKTEYERALGQMKFKTRPTEEIILMLSDMQDEASDFARNVVHQLEKTNVAREIFNNERKKLERLEDQHSALTSEHNRLLHLEKYALYKKRTQLRRIHALLEIQQHNEEYIQELDLQHEEIRSQIPITKTNLAILVIAGILAVFGASLLVAYFLFGISEINLSFIVSIGLSGLFPKLSAENPYYHIHSTIAFLLFFIGFIGGYLNIPQTNPYRKKKIVELSQASNRLGAAIAKLKATQEELNELQNELNIDNLQPETLLYAEEMIDEEQEQIITKEKLMKATFSTEDELKKVKENLSRVQKNFFEEDAKGQELRREWQEHFQKLPVVDVPSPEGVEVFFSRINHVRLLNQNVKNLEQEIVELRTSVEKMYSTGVAQFPKISYYKDDIENLFLKVQSFIDQSLEYDKQNEKRLYLEENMGLLDTKLQNLQNALQEEEAKKTQLEKEFEVLKEQWRNYLREQKLNDNLSPQSAKTALSQIEKCREIKAKLEELQQDKKMQENERDKLALPLLDIFAQLDRTPLFTLDKQIDSLASMDLLYNEAIKAKELFQAKLTIEEQIQGIDDEISSSLNEETSIKASIKELLNEVGLESESEFEEKSRQAHELANLQKKKQNLEDTLQFFAVNKEFKEFIAEFEGLDLPVLRYKKEQLEKTLQDVKDEKEACTHTLADLKSKIQQVENSSLLSELKEEQISLEEQTEKALKDYLAYAFARSFVMKAKQKYEKENQPELIKTASEIFAQITDGRWTNISSSIENSTLYVNPKQGLPHTPDQLSQGTREQLYLALRLAHIRNVAQYKEPLPLILDDILVNFDTLRSTQTAKTLASFTKNQNQQILFFTCHPHIANILQENVEGAKLYKIHAGKISEA